MARENMIFLNKVMCENLQLVIPKLFGSLFAFAEELKIQDDNVDESLHTGYFTKPAIVAMMIHGILQRTGHYFMLPHALLVEACLIRMERQDVNPSAYRLMRRISYVEWQHYFVCRERNDDLTKQFIDDGLYKDRPEHILYPTACMRFRGRRDISMTQTQEARIHPIAQRARQFNIYMNSIDWEPILHKCLVDFYSMPGIAAAMGLSRSTIHAFFKESRYSRRVLLFLATNGYLQLDRMPDHIMQDITKTGRKRYGYNDHPKTGNYSSRPKHNPIPEGTEVSTESIL